MSTSQESNPSVSRNSPEALIQFFGTDRNQADGILESLDERYFRPLAKFAKALSAALTPILESIAVFVNSTVQELAAAPEVPGHERLLIDSLGHCQLAARFWASQIRHWGELLAAEFNEGRRVRAIIDEIAKADGRSTLVMSRRAMKFRDECSSVEAQDHVELAMKKAGLSASAYEFKRLVGLASERDEEACHDLGRIARQIAPHLPDKRGRPISVATCTHIFLLRHFEAMGKSRAFTVATDDEIGDFVDEATLATRLAMDQPRFSPRHAQLLRKRKELEHPVPFRDSTKRRQPTPTSGRAGPPS